MLWFCIYFADHILIKIILKNSVLRAHVTCKHLILVEKKEKSHTLLHYITQTCNRCEEARHDRHHPADRHDG